MSLSSDFRYHFLPLRAPSTLWNSGWWPAQLTTHLNWYFTFVQYELIYLHSSWEFPGSSVGKESTWSAGDPSSIPGSGRRRKWQPTLVFLPGKSHGQRSLAGYSPWGWKESTRLSNFTCTFRSSLLHAGFLQLQRVGLLSSFGARASHCGGLSCCRAWALEHWRSSCGSRACKISPDQGCNQCPLPCKADS